MSNIVDGVCFDEKDKHCEHRYAEHHQEVLFDLEAGFSRAFGASQSTWAHHHLSTRFRSEPAHGVGVMQTLTNDKSNVGEHFAYSGSRGHQ